MKRFLLALLFLTLPALAHAQAITSYTVTISGIAPAVLPIASWVCGVTPKTVAIVGVINPTKIILDDPASPTTADCVYTDPVAGGILHSLPFGPTSYTATALATNSAGNSLVSATSLPFTRPGGVPTAPAGLRLARFSWRQPLARKHYLVG